MLNTNDKVLRRNDDISMAIKLCDEALSQRIAALTAQNDDDKEFFNEMAEWAEASAERFSIAANEWRF